MSFIDSESIEEITTDASVEKLEAVLKEFGYSITKTRLQITATKNSFWSSTASLISITDDGNFRHCVDKESAKGYLIKPKSGILAQIISKAEKM